MNWEEHFEGKLMLHRWVTVMGSTQYMFHEDYYTLKDGIVYHIAKDGHLDPSGDKAVELCSNLHVGEYDPNNLPKQRSLRVFDHEELEKAFEIIEKEREE